MPCDPSLLRSVERPGRYLGGEIGSEPNRVPDGRGRLFRVALAFPDVYEIAHSHLGHKILWALVNSEPGLSAERCYAPWTDMERLLRGSGSPLRSLESGTPLGAFGLVGFSLQYELGYTNILAMLELGGIPLLASSRDGSHPLVAAGGPGCANPEPLADFFDFFFLGDAEPNLIPDLKEISRLKAEGAPRAEILRGLSRRPGIYVPSLYRPSYAGEGLSRPFLGLVPLDPEARPLRKITAPSLSGLFFPKSQIVPFIRPVHDRVAVEIARGCSRGCRFCQAGYIYRPARERGASEALDLVSRNLAATGLDEAAFLALSAGDHTLIGPLVKGFMDRYGGSGVSLSLPSLRARSVTRDLALQIQRARKTGFTVAPEAATARLRAVINKDLTEDDVLSAAEAAFSLGWRTLKLYFMCGLPTETEEDLAAVGRLAKRIKGSTRARLNVGLAHFTPKAHTPFQWERGSLQREIAARIGTVKAACRQGGIAVKHADPGASFAESLVARGDRRMSRVILKVFRKGARFEAWNDLFRPGLWEEALAEEGFDPAVFARDRDPEAPLPWDHVFYGVEKNYLLRERERAYAGLPTPDCRDSGCRGCGACSDGASVDLAARRFPEEALQAAASASGPENRAGPEAPPAVTAAGIAAGAECQRGAQARQTPLTGDALPALEGPRAPDCRKSPGYPHSPDCPADRESAGAASRGAGRPERPAASGEAGRPQAERPAPRRKPRPQAPPMAAAPPEYRYLARFAKTGRPVFLGHLELVELFKRAFRRGGLSLALTRGFHPSPKLSFLTALPLGVPSEDEIMIFSLLDDVGPAEILARLTLPEGVRAREAERLPASLPRPALKGARWLVTAPSPAFAGPPLFPQAHLSYTDKRGRPRDFPLQDWILEAETVSPESAAVALSFRDTLAPKPLDAARALWGLDPSLPLELSKLKTLTE
ncbi:MAG: TIGR03960 family B12-binding radical SAM protein [Deltaproteobacteria bacterium]|nr:TIGR03960 family B12-binding radical SAM protein [Deltaproteobacteria bacterium]